MHSKAFTALLFAGLAAAAPQATDSDNSVVTDIPSNVQSELYSALPTSVQQELATNLGALPSIWSQYATNTEWQSSLPSDAQSWISGAKSSLSGSESGSDSTATATGDGSSTILTGSSATATETGSSATATSSGTVTSTVATTTASATVTSGSQTGSQTASSSGASSSADATETEGETSTGGAPAPTGNLAMGLAGAAGVLGVAFVL
ncbi:hypothetical protein PENSTE_c007G05519 [Penicillium steckii]|uniref:GPI anchored protein n=1 Tax=Penicillium steckii TaxID=303698 RepID=A0A1V6TF83_9EURO|nr:hypothetical protein PENSTE_c007G05519 [Penicillium steckii]